MHRAFRWFSVHLFIGSYLNWLASFGGSITNAWDIGLGDTSVESVKEGHSQGDNPGPLQDQAPYVKATIEDLSAYVSRQKARCLLPWTGF
jgi:hypothetical protein